MNNKTTYKIGDIVKVIDSSCEMKGDNGYYTFDKKLHLRNILKDGSLGKNTISRYEYRDKNWEGEKGKVVSINEDVNGKKYIVGFYPILRSSTPHPYYPSLWIDELDESSYDNCLYDFREEDGINGDYDDYTEYLMGRLKYNYEVYKNGIECSPSNIQLVDDNLMISEKEELISRRKEQLEMKKKEIEQLTKELEQMKSLV